MRGRHLTHAETTYMAEAGNRSDRQAKRSDHLLRSISVLYRTIYLLYKKNDAACHALGNLDLVAGFPDQIGNIDHRQWIGAVDFEEVARWDRLQRFARFQRRQRAFETGKIEFHSRHVPNMAKPRRSVNTAFSSQGAGRKRLHQACIRQESDR